MPQMTLDEILASAKAFLAKDHVVDDARRKAAGGRGGTSQTEQQLREESRMAPVVKRAVDTAALPAALLPSPLQPLAAGYLGVRGVEEAVEDPNLLNIGMAAMGGIPFIKPIKAAVSRAKTAAGIKRTRETYGAGDMGATVGKEVPYRAGGGASTPSGVTAAPGPTRAGHVVGHDLDHVPTPKTYQPPQGTPGPTEPETMLQRARQQVEQFHQRNPAMESLAGGASVADDVAPVVDDIEQVLMRQADEFDNGALPAHLRALDDAHEARMADWRQIPPAPDSKAHFVKEHVGKSQQEMAQELGERDLGWKGRVNIKRVKAPLYPSGDSKVDKLVAAMRQREKLMGFQD